MISACTQVFILMSLSNIYFSSYKMCVHAHTHARVNKRMCAHILCGVRVFCLFSHHVSLADLKFSLYTRLASSGE